MRNLFVILFVLAIGNSFAQKNIYSDMNVHGKTFAKDSLIVEKAMKIGSSLLLSPLDTVYKESLNERDFATSTKWITTGSFSISGGTATFSGTSGTLRQKENKLALTGLGGSKYRFIYTVSNMTGVGCTAFINTDFALSNTNLVLVNAIDTLNFTSGSDPTDFKIECTCTSGGFDLDDFSLKIKSDSIVFIKNNLYTDGIFTKSGSTFGGDVQVLGNLKGGSPLTISTPIGEIEIDGDIHLIKDTENWTIGIDAADANQFKISNDVILGINDRLIIDNLGNVGIGITPVAGARLTLPQEDDAVTPTLAFGDGNTGFYERVDNDLRVTVGGVNRFIFFLDQFRSVQSTGPAMINVGATSFTPTLIPDISDVNTGIGQAADDQLSLIAGSVESMRLNVTGNHVVNSLLDAATGNEVALSLNYTVNKATSGDDVGLLINQTNTLSPGTSLLMDLQVGSVSKFNVDETGKTVAGKTEIGDWPFTANNAYFGHSDLNHSADGNYALRQNSVGATFFNSGGGQALTFEISGAPKMTVNSVGNLDVAGAGQYLINSASVLSTTTLGTSVVNSSLTSIGALTSLVIDNAGAGANPTLSSNSANQDLLITGNVGIGIAAPANKLHVITAGNPARFESNSGNGRIEIDAPDTKNAGMQLFENGVLRWGIFNQGTGDALKIQDQNFTTRFTVLQDGKVGIGTTDPQTNLHIQESNTETTPTVEIEQLSTGDAALQFSIVGDAYAMGIDNSDADKFKISYAVGAGTAVLGTNDRFVIDTSGNVGIGTISASEKLEVRGSIIAEDGFAKKLFKVSTSVFETAVRGTEYNSPNQHGGLYGTVFRKYFAIPDILSAGLTINIALGLTPNDVLQVGGYVVENTSGDKIIIGSGSGNTASNIGMHVQVVGSNLELDANDTLDWNSGECWIDYTK